MAGNINTILNTCGFDGVDFDIEDSSGNVPSNFANTAASLINTLRSLNEGLYISLTTPAQAWGAGMYQKSLLDLVIGNINVWQPMEYDLWIETGSTYANQIQYDINFYSCSENSKINNYLPYRYYLDVIKDLEEPLPKGYELYHTSMMDKITHI